MHEINITDEARLNWDDCRMFLAVARAGQIFAAARALGVNQATLSRRMAALEVAVGAKLLVRRTHGSDLSEAGRELFETLERVESELIAGQARLRGTEGGVSGVVRVGAPDGFGVAFLAPKLARLAERHPDLRIQLVPTPRGFSLSRREADVAVLVGRPDRGRLIARKLTDYSLGLYASRDYLAREGEPASLADLAKHSLVGYVEDLITVPALNYSASFLRDWRSRFEISSAIGQVEAVRAGAGIGVLHDYLARGSAELVPVLRAHRVTRSYWTAIHEDLRDVARVRVISDFLIEIVREAQRDFGPPSGDAAPEGA